MSASEITPEVSALAATSDGFRVSSPAAATIAGSTNRLLARYVLKTKVVTTALKAADPQSHSAHAATRRRGGAAGSSMRPGAAVVMVAT
ncbi:hypothetical protein CMMCAS02_00835 [Clavibacter michiganensis subsp. michiganensis]|nr:hypothetical protein CMMCAS02_00835 [Clavibacter michiganensis subsp. michiganensis]